MQEEKRVCYIFVTGGVVSSLGKGIAASSVGRLLKNRGFKVFMQKFDPYKCGSRHHVTLSTWRGFRYR